MSVVSLAPRRPTAALEQSKAGEWHVTLSGDLGAEFDHLRSRVFFAAPAAYVWLSYLQYSRGFGIIFTYTAERWRRDYHLYCESLFGGVA